MGVLPQLGWNVACRAAVSTAEKAPADAFSVRLGTLCGVSAGGQGGFQTSPHFGELYTQCGT